MNDRGMSLLNVPNLRLFLTTRAVDQDCPPPGDRFVCPARSCNQAGAELLACMLMLLLSGAVLAAMWITAGRLWSLFLNPYIL